MRLPAAEFDAEVEDVAALLVDHLDRAGGISGSACGSCRRLWIAVEHRRIRSQLARGRARPSREAGPPPTRAMRLPFFLAAGFGNRSRMSSL